jgi:CrcB protein
VAQEKRVNTLAKYLAVAAGGAVGAMLRYYLTLSGLGRVAQPFPTATFVINITGSFIIGFFLTLATERIPINPHVRLAVAVGFVGAFTTFSTFEYETARLLEGRDFLYGFLYVVLSFAIGFGAVWAGIVVARQVKGVAFASHITIGHDLVDAVGIPKTTPSELSALTVDMSGSKTEKER